MDTKFKEVTLLTNWQEKIGNWACDTFPQSTDASRIEHMSREVEELRQKPDDPFEAADIMLLLLHHAHVNGYDLFAAVQEKYQIIKRRTWHPPDAMGVVHRVKNSEEEIINNEGC